MPGVSIHAPVRGATVLSESTTIPFGFQSTHPYGVRPRSFVTHFVASRFQSTHPYGERLDDFEPDFIVQEFQSTHPYGVRPLNCFRISGFSEFQSTHPGSLGLRALKGAPKVAGF